jgi:DNA-binding HxlR family transcriptional regulator
MKSTVSGCPIEDAMRLLSGRWRTLLIYYLIDGPKRFSDLQRDNPTISHRMLTLDLRELEAAGVIARTVYPTVPPRVEYALTEDGRRLVPLINALGDWWDSRHEGKAPTLEDASGPEPSRAALAAACD